MLLLLIPIGFSVQPDDTTGATLGGLAANSTERHLLSCSIETAMLNPTTTRECLQHAQGMFHFSSPTQEEFDTGICIRVGNWWTHVALADAAANARVSSECACPQDSQSSIREFLPIVKRLVSHFTATLFAELMELPDNASAALLMKRRTIRTIHTTTRTITTPMSPTTRRRSETCATRTCR